VEVPRIRAGTFDPVVVPKHARRLAGFEANVLSLYAILNTLSITYGDRLASTRPTHLHERN
jgi:transposase-like protein